MSYKIQAVDDSYIQWRRVHPRGGWLVLNNDKDIAFFEDYEHARLFVRTLSTLTAPNRAAKRARESYADLYT